MARAPQSIRTPEDEVLGVNSRSQLAIAERTWQDRARQAAMDNGATLTAPETVFFSYDTVDRPRRHYRAERRVRARRHHRRRRRNPGLLPLRRRQHRRRTPASAPSRGCAPARCSATASTSATSSRSRTSRSATAPRPTTSPISATASVGAGANIGAGTITCNYDGFVKHKTEIGEGAFIGSNTSLVAPVKIGDGAYVGSGSVITKDVAPDALGARPRDRRKNGRSWAAKFRTLMARRKAGNRET